MIARFLAVRAVALVATPLLADDRFFGTWEGDAIEQGSEAAYRATISIFEVDGRIFQHTVYGAPVNCDGGGVLMEQSTGTLHLSEVIVRNRETCADGTIRVYLNGERKLIWEWFYPDGQYGARADLTKIGK